MSSAPSLASSHPVAPRDATAAFAAWNHDVVSLFAAQVARAPEAIAIVDGDATLTYGALDRRVNQLARHLISLGVTPRARVAICIERSLASIVGVLAILTAGATYVPIDPQVPIDRARFMVRDADVAYTLTARTLDPALRAALTRPIEIDDPALVAAYAARPPGLAIAPSTAAYVMYTSGTAGTPKGVAVPHSGISRLVRHASYLALDEHDVVLHHATCAFDAATFEMWAALLNGGRLVIHRAALDLDALAGVIQRDHITTILLTTSVFHLVAQHRPDSLTGVRKLVTGGDVMQARAVKRVLALHPEITIINGYGPTENTTFTCCHSITRDTPIGDTVPIGKPIAGTHVVLLDDAMREVAVGEPGQLYTSGLGMGHGYLNRDDLNRQHFVASPVPELGPVLYRTGDLAREDADGNFHFIGRADRQVKIRGFRVEPGEVEHALVQRAGVADALVTAETTGDEKRLIAYVQRARDAHGAALAEAALKHALADHVPHYMVPSRLHLVDQFPLTANGKIDKAALRHQIGAAVELAAAAPTIEMSPTAAAVLDAWRRQLHAPALAGDASVYDHGASSLTVMVVHNELAQHFQCSIPPGELALAHTPLAWADIYDRHLRLAPERPGAGAADPTGERQ